MMHKRQQSQPDATGNSATGIAAAAPQRGVGAALRQRRTDFGFDLEEVSAQLRIRVSHLVALEEGNYADLPGLTYALGYVRAYARLLQMDEEAVLRRFREEAESGSVAGKPVLSLPTVAPEGKTPNAMMMAVALLAFIGLYGVWAWMDRQPVVKDVITPPPERLAQATVSIGGAAGMPAGMSASDGGFPQALTAPQAAVALTEPVTLTEPVAVVGTEAPPAVVTEVAETEAAKTEVAAPVAVANAPTETPQTEPVLPQARTAPVVAQAVVPVVPEVAVAPVAREVGVVSTPVTSPASRAAQLAQDPDTLEPVVSMEGASDSRGHVTVIAQQTTWIGVYSAPRRIVSERILKPGEEFVAPNQEGWFLRIGNAGGVAYSVNGQKVPPLGQSGARINVPLDPDDFMALAESVPSAESGTQE